MKSADAVEAANRSTNLLGARVAKVTLNQSAGYVMKTGNRRTSHHTWWPYETFDVLASCEVMT